jgi:NitT/TauT family transport system ATP-binding protein
MPVSGLTGSDPIVIFENVALSLGGDRIYDQLTFGVQRGEFLCIVGPSGCGKSTSLRLIGGLLDADSGRTAVDGRPPRDAWSDIAFVFQSPRLVPWRNAIENVLLGPQLRLGAGDRESRKRRAAELLRLVGLVGETLKYPSMLSGGERQRVAIARALAVDPKIVLMDEPFSALDPNMRARMRAEMERIWMQTGKTVVFVTHDIDEALQLADRIIVFSAKPTRVLETIEVSAPRPRVIGGPDVEEIRTQLVKLFQSIEHPQFAQESVV